MTKEEFRTRRNKLITMWENTDLTKKEVSEVFDMHHSTVCSILTEERAEKRNNLKEKRPHDVNPCMLTLKVWPRCLGQGCHWVGEDGHSECPAYNAMQNGRAL